MIFILKRKLLKSITQFEFLFNKMKMFEMILYISIYICMGLYVCVCVYLYLVPETRIRFLRLVDLLFIGLWLIYLD